MTIRASKPSAAGYRLKRNAPNEGSVLRGGPSVMPGRTRCQVLLAEDNPLNQKLAIRLLEKLGHSVSLARDGQQAIEMSAQAAFDLLLLDIQMPGLDGLAAARAIRQREAQSERRTPIIAITAGDRRADRERCEQAGMDGFISKPLNGADIAAEIKRVLSAPRPAAARQAPRGGQGNLGTALRFLESAPRPADAPDLDTPDAMRRFDGDLALFAEIAAVFRADTRKRVAALQAALEASDGPALARAAHSLKGSAANVSATQLCQLAQQLEQCGKSNTLAAARAVFAQLPASIARLDQAFQALRI